MTIRKSSMLVTLCYALGSFLTFMELAEISLHPENFSVFTIALIIAISCVAQLLLVVRLLNGHPLAIERSVERPQAEGLYPAYGNGTAQDVENLIRNDYSAAATRLYAELHDVPTDVAGKAIREQEKTLPVSPRHALHHSRAVTAMVMIESAMQMTPWAPSMSGALYHDVFNGIAIILFFPMIYFFFKVKEDAYNTIDNLRAEGIYPPYGAGTDEDVLRLLCAGHKLAAIRLYREIHSVPLKAAVAAVKHLSCTLKSNPTAGAPS